MAGSAGVVVPGSRGSRGPRTRRRWRRKPRASRSLASRRRSGCSTRTVRASGSGSSDSSAGGVRRSSRGCRPEPGAAAWRRGRFTGHARLGSAGGIRRSSRGCCPEPGAAAWRRRRFTGYAWIGSTAIGRAAGRGSRRIETPPEGELPSHAEAIAGPVLTFLREYAWLLLLLALYGAVGGFLLVPFRRTIKYALFAAPLAGLLISSCGIAALYTVLGLSLATSAAAMAVVGGAATIVALARSRPRLARDDLALVLIAAAVAAVAVYLANATTIKLGAPGFLYMDGTDQLGYAQLADWLRAHPIHQLPDATPARPYESWPEFSFHTDPRFGAYFTLAVISLLRGESGMFAYDNATAVVLLAGYVAIAAVLARSPRGFALLLVGLLTCHWFEYRSEER